MRTDFAIVANPVSHKFLYENGLETLENISKQIEASLHCLNTKSRSDFMYCVSEISKEYKNIIVAGGDGTFSDAINSIRKENILSYLPFGKGNALKYALNLNNIDDIIDKAINGDVHTIDTILYKDRKTLMVGIGVDGSIVERMEVRYKSKRKQLLNYIITSINSILLYKRGNAEIKLNNKDKKYFRNVLSILVMKHPFYGSNFMVSPMSKLDDGFLDVNILNFSIMESAIVLFKNIFREGTPKNYFKSKSIKIMFDKKQPLHLDGTYMGKSKEFYFEVLPKSLKMRY